MFVGCKGDANCWKRDKTNDDLSGTFVESYLKDLFRAIRARFGVYMYSDGNTPNSFLKHLVK